DRTGEEGSPTVSAELRGAATQGVAVLVDQVGCGEIGGHVGSSSMRGHRACSPEAEHTPGTPLSYWPVHQGSLAPSSTRVPPLHTHRSFRDPERFKLGQDKGFPVTASWGFRHVVAGRFPVPSCSFVPSLAQPLWREMISEIFAISSAWSRAMIELSTELDPWAQSAAKAGTDLLLVIFAVLFVAAWWRARSRSSRAVGLALFAPAATIIAYLASRTVKLFFEQLRPCQAMTDLTTIATCDPIGDWSFPSNHATIAGAAAAAIVLT